MIRKNVLAAIIATLGFVGIGSNKVFAANFYDDFVKPSMEATQFCQPIFEHLRKQMLPTCPRETPENCIPASIELGIKTTEVEGEGRTNCILKGRLLSVRDVSLRNVVVGTLLGVGQEEVALGDFKRLPANDGKHIFAIQLFADPITDPSAFIENFDHFVLSYEGHDNAEYKKRIYFSDIKYNGQFMVLQVGGSVAPSPAHFEGAGTGLTQQELMLKMQAANDGPVASHSAGDSDGCQLNPQATPQSSVGMLNLFGVVGFLLLMIRKKTTPRSPPRHQNEASCRRAGG